MTGPAVIRTQRLCLREIYAVFSVCGYGFDSLHMIRDGQIAVGSAFPIARIRSDI